VNKLFLETKGAMGTWWSTPEPDKPLAVTQEEKRVEPLAAVEEEKQVDLPQTPVSLGYVEMIQRW
jgi:hypothetical protein